MPQTSTATKAARAAILESLERLSTLPDSADISVSEVSALCDCCTEHISRLAKAGRFPKPHRLGRIRRWNIGIVRKFLRDQAEAAQACA